MTPFCNISGLSLQTCFLKQKGDEMNIKKRVWRFCTTVLGVLILSGICLYIYIPSVPALFKLNKECQEEGFYMAEFEFKMLGLAYYLDKGHYMKALTGLKRLQKQLKSRAGLVKMPEFADKKQELAFYLDLQNPRTGAFMDDFYPMCVYHGPTGNVLLHLDALAEETGQPLRLKYPLKYLDEINTPQKVKAYFDEISTVGWIAAKFPQTTFHQTRDILSSINGEGNEIDMIEKHNLYAFSPEWKEAVLQWFYENQDPETGFWGPRSRRSGRLVKLDLSNTASIVKSFVDRDGNNIYAPFPLRYKNEMFTTALQVMSEATPSSDDKLDEWHEWALKMRKGTYLLTRYLWHDASEEQKTNAKKLMEKYLRTHFEKYYIPGEGAFSYYPGSQHATLDGTSGGLSFYSDLGAFSTEKQKRLWGSGETCSDLGQFNVSALMEKDFDSIRGVKNVNAWRFYSAVPGAENYTAHVVGIFYPEITPVLDVMEFIPKLRDWINTTSQSMGNWVSREEILDRLSGIRIESVPVSVGNIPLEQVNGTLEEHNVLTVIGFDVLQIPRSKITFHLIK